MQERREPHRFEESKTTNPKEGSAISHRTNAIKEILASEATVSKTLRKIMTIEVKKHVEDWLEFLFLQKFYPERFSKLPF